MGNEHDISPPRSRFSRHPTTPAQGPPSKEVHMFRVENADFIADKLSTELLPSQEFREVLKNALEAIDRRMRTDGSREGGRVEFDVDWNLHARSGRWYVC